MSANIALQFFTSEILSVCKHINNEFFVFFVCILAKKTGQEIGGAPTQV
jgi:hypothetical protein